jgi:hypothetical protein
MAAMDRSVAWRAALLQGLLLLPVAIVLALTLSHEFFEDWGWLVGPAAWAGCALATGSLLRLPAVSVLAGAAVSGLPGVAAVLAGVHWAGTPAGLAIFGAWCGWLARRSADAPTRGRLAARTASGR